MSLAENFSEELMVVSLYIFILKYYKPQHTLNIKGTKERGEFVFVGERFPLIRVGARVLNCLESGKTNNCHRRQENTADTKIFFIFLTVSDILLANIDISSIFQNKKVIAKILLTF